MIVVATQEEYKYIKDKYKRTDVFITGVGALNIFNSLKDVPRHTPIINLGYAGSRDIPIGTIVSIGECELYHPNVSYSEAKYKLSGKYKCFTACDFVTQSQECNCVFDMELAFIMAMGFNRIRSYKIISDNLSVEQYGKTTNT